MNRYYLSKDGTVLPDGWQGRMKAAVMQAPAGCGCVIETDRRFTFSSNGCMSSAQAAFILAKVDEGKAVLARNLKPRRANQARYFKASAWDPEVCRTGASAEASNCSCREISPPLWLGPQFACVQPCRSSGNRNYCHDYLPS